MAKSREANGNWRGGREVPCVICGKMRWFKPSYIAKGTKLHCSMKCLAESRKGSQCKRWSGGDLKRQCKVCSKEFVAKRGDVNRGRGFCCSRDCALVTLRKRLTVLCRQCGSEFETLEYKRITAKYCSRPCLDKGRLKQRTPEEIARNRLGKRVGTLMWQALKDKKAGRSWESLVGYTVQELMKHLEVKFTEGMSWENIGKWHIDHIKPRSLFSYTTPEDDEFKRCWALDNLQPLWELDNLRKGAKYAA